MPVQARRQLQRATLPAAAPAAAATADAADASDAADGRSSSLGGGGGTGGTGGQRSVIIVYLLVVLYALCYQLQSPIEPFLEDKLTNSTGSESAVAYAKVKSLFSVTQGLGSLGFGWLLDR